MHTNGAKKVLAVLDDLFFTVKITAAAKQAGVIVEVVKDEASTLKKAKDQPMLIILDLNCNSVDTLDLIGKLKSDEELKGIDLLGFVSHVEVDLKRRAQDTGCDMVMARSAFSLNLPQILKRHSGAR